MSKVSSALAKYKHWYAGRVRTGEDALNVTEIFSHSKSKMVRASLREGRQVYALPIYGGKGMLEKWEVDSEGSLVRDANGKPIFKHGPKQIVAMFLCSPETKNIGSDELVVGKEDSMEGIRRREALSVFERLDLNPDADAYVLFIRKPQEIGAAVRGFRERLDGILTHGPKWRPPYRLIIKMDRRFIERQVIQIAAQTHPHLRTRAVADFFGPQFMTDPYVWSRVKPIIEKLKTPAVVRKGKRGTARR